MDSMTILGGIANAVIMLTLPLRAFHNTWRIPQGRWKVLDDLNMMLCCMYWELYIKYHREKLLLIDLMHFCYLFLFIWFSHTCLRTLKNRFTDLVIVLVKLLAIFIIARLGKNLYDPVEFSFTVLVTGTTFISLMGVLCDPRRSSFSVIWMFAKVVVFSVVGICLSDRSILIPNLMGGLLGLVLLLV